MSDKSKLMNWLEEWKDNEEKNHQKMKVTWDKCTQNGIPTKTTMEIKKTERVHSVVPLWSYVSEHNSKLRTINKPWMLWKSLWSTTNQQSDM